MQISHSEHGALRVIGRLDPPAFEMADFPGFSAEQVRAGLTVLPVVLRVSAIGEEMA